MVAESHQHSPMADLDWAEMEGLFCQQATAITTTPMPISNSPRLGGLKDDMPKRENQEVYLQGFLLQHKIINMRDLRFFQIILLDGKKSLNVNIFLKQFRRYTQCLTNFPRER